MSQARTRQDQSHFGKELEVTRDMVIWSSHGEEWWEPSCRDGLGGSWEPHSLDDHVI